MSSSGRTFHANKVAAKPCPVCFALSLDVPLSSLIEGAVEQWAAIQEHEKHTEVFDK